MVARRDTENHLFFLFLMISQSQQRDFLSDNQLIEKDWEDAINKDKLNWLQISDLKYWKNKIAQDYYIRSIPSNFLLGTNGKIIARNLSLGVLRREPFALYRKVNGE